MSEKNGVGRPATRMGQGRQQGQGWVKVSSEEEDGTKRVEIRTGQATRKIGQVGQHEWDEVWQLARRRIGWGGGKVEDGPRRATRGNQMTRTHLGG